MESDAELLHRYARDRSEAAFRELVRRHLDLVYSAALRQMGGDRHQAEDVAQLTFACLAEKAPTLLRHPTLRGWLYTCTHHTASGLVRTERRRKARELEAHAMEAINADTPIDWAQVRPELDEAMHELNERDRHAILLRFFDQRPMSEIGTVLGLSESAARRATDRALDTLRDLLARRGITSTATALGTVLATQTVSAAPASLASTVGTSVLAGLPPPAPTLWPGLLASTKLKLAALGLSLLLNATLVSRVASRNDSPPQDPVAPNPPGAAVPFVPPAPLVGDFSDPAFLARKLHLEGYSERAVREAVYDAVLEPYRDRLDAIWQKHYERQTRWQPQHTLSDSRETLPIFNAVQAETDRILKALPGTVARR